jgi:hypothetical protein
MFWYIIPIVYIIGLFLVGMSIGLVEEDDAFLIDYLPLIVLWPVIGPIMLMWLLVVFGFNLTNRHKK